MKRAALTTLLAGLAGSLIAMGIVVSAPGNAIRQAQFPASPSLPLLTIILLWSTISFVATAIIIFSPVPFMTSLVFSGMLANRWQQIDPRKLAYFKRRALRLLLLTASVGMILLLGSFLPASYSLSDLPPPRALIIMQFVLVLVVIAWGVIMGISLKKPDQRATSPANSRIVLAVLAVLLIIGPIRSTWNTLSLTGAFRTYAEEWDALDREIRLAVQNGTRDLQIAPYTVDLADYVDVVTIDPDPHQGANTCIAQYYGLDTISTG
jgi:hypothetical protein